MSVRSTLVDAFYSLSANINKRSGDTSQETQEGVVGSLIPELTLDIDDEELSKLSDTWQKSWSDSDVKAKWSPAGDENERYWLGDHYNRPELEGKRASKDNAIFEGLETYLPQVTRRNPEAMVSLASSEEQTDPNQQYVKALQNEINDIADTIRLRLKLKGTARHWSIRLLGAIKLGWDVANDRPEVKVLRPQKLELDPDATVDEDGYSGNRIGEHKKLQASELVAILKKVKAEKFTENIEYITKELAKDQMATEIAFLEWWTPDYMFWKLNSRILLKRKNPHWNYDEEAPTDEASSADESETAPETPELPQGAPQMAQTEEAPQSTPNFPQGAPALPDMANVAPPTAPPVPRKGFNHFKTRRIPYLLLSVYNLGKQPVDITSLMGQNLANQDLINKRIRQVDRNGDNTNGGMVVSLARSGLTKDQAKGVTKTLRDGGIVAIPDGAPQEAIYKPPMYELPAFIYNQLVDTRNRVRDIWGTRGSSPAGPQTETTVRGKIINQQLDTDRIGGGISEYLEQLAESVFDWTVQLLYVYDQRFIDQIANGVEIPRVKVTVKEGSLLPKDSTTISNQAQTLATAGKMAVVDMYKRMDYPNAEELAANVWLEINAPEVLYGKDPRVAQVIQQRQEQAANAAQGEKKPPSVSINYKDLPPEGQAQAAAEAGITLHPEGIAAHAGNKEAASKQPLPVEQGAPVGA